LTVYDPQLSLPAMRSISVPLQSALKPHRIACTLKHISPLSAPLPSSAYSCMVPLKWRGGQIRPPTGPTVGLESLLATCGIIIHQSQPPSPTTRPPSTPSRSRPQRFARTPKVVYLPRATLRGGATPSVASAPIRSCRRAVGCLGSVQGQI